MLFELDQDVDEALDAAVGFAGVGENVGLFREQNELRETPFGIHPRALDCAVAGVCMLGLTTF